VLLPHREEVEIEDLRVFQGHLVLAERQLGHTTLTVYCLPTDNTPEALSHCRYNSTAAAVARLEAEHQQQQQHQQQEAEVEQQQHDEALASIVQELSQKEGAAAAAALEVVNLVAAGGGNSVTSTDSSSSSAESLFAMQSATGSSEEEVGGNGEGGPGQLVEYIQEGQGGAGDSRNILLIRGRSGTDPETGAQGQEREQAGSAGREEASSVKSVRSAPHGRTKAVDELGRRGGISPGLARAKWLPKGVDTTSREGWGVQGIGWPRRERGIRPDHLEHAHQGGVASDGTTATTATTAAAAGASGNHDSSSSASSVMAGTAQEAPSNVGAGAADGSGVGSYPVLLQENSWQVAFEEDSYSVSMLDSGGWGSRVLRLRYSSFTIPDSVIDIHLSTQQHTQRSQRRVGGGFSSQDYRSYRLWAAAEDGVQVSGSNGTLEVRAEKWT
jgi:hypothetical protein